MTCYRWAFLALSTTVLGIGLSPSGASARAPSGSPHAGRSLALLAAADVTYDVYLVSIRVRESKANGDSWDPAGGKPDLKIILTNERTGQTSTSEVAKDTYAVKFESSLPVLQVTEGDILRIRV